MLGQKAAKRFRHGRQKQLALLAVLPRLSCTSSNFVGQLRTSPSLRQQNHALPRYPSISEISLTEIPEVFGNRAPESCTSEISVPKWPKNRALPSKLSSKNREWTEMAEVLDASGRKGQKCESAQRLSTKNGTPSHWKAPRITRRFDAVIRSPSTCWSRPRTQRTWP